LEDWPLQLAPVSRRFGWFPAGGGEEAHGLAITAIEREGDPHAFTVVAANLKAHHVKSRPAKVGDKLKTVNFSTGTRGFASPDDP